MENLKWHYNNYRMSNSPQCWHDEWTRHRHNNNLVFTDRVRSTRGGNIFSLSVCPHPGGVVPRPADGGGGGVPCPADGGGVPHPADGGGTPSSWWWGVPQPGGTSARGVPQLGGTLAGGVPQSGWYPGRGGTPVRMVPWQGGYPSQGVPQQGGVPGVPPHQSSIAWTCYAAVGMPLAC